MVSWNELPYEQVEAMAKARCTPEQWEQLTGAEWMALLDELQEEWERARELERRLAAAEQGGELLRPGVPPGVTRAEVTDLLLQAGVPDPAYDARELLRLAAGQDPRLLDAPLTAEQLQTLTALTLRRCRREPLQYLRGEWEFMDFSLAVGPGVLCPRADTEVVAEAALQAVRTLQPRVLDLCAGTGCLGLAVKRFCPFAQVTALEKSPDALPYLRRNAAHALDGKGGVGPAPYLTVAEGDLFAFYKTQPDAAYDLILSNPPYLTAAEMAILQPEVQQEPAMALAAGADGLDFYRAIAEHYFRLVRPGGALVLEIGWQQRQAVTDLLAQHGWVQIECRKDYGGNDRCVLARRPAE